jgi:zinc-finger of acetyl-transferase ESCO
VSPSSSIAADADAQQQQQTSILNFFAKQPKKRKATAASAAPVQQQQQQQQQQQEHEQPSKRTQQHTTQRQQTQLYIDMGQSNFGKRSICPICGMLTVHGMPQDKHEHEKICHDYLHGVAFHFGNTCITNISTNNHTPSNNNTSSSLSRQPPQQHQHQQPSTTAAAAQQQSVGAARVVATLSADAKIVEVCLSSLSLKCGVCLLSSLFLKKISGSLFFIVTSYTDSSDGQSHSTEQAAASTRHCRSRTWFCTGTAAAAVAIIISIFFWQDDM